MSNPHFQQDLRGTYITPVVLPATATPDSCCMVAQDLPVPVIPQTQDYSRTATAANSTAAAALDSSYKNNTWYVDNYQRACVIRDSSEIGFCGHLEVVVPGQISARDSRRNVEARPWLHPQIYSLSRCVRAQQTAPRAGKKQQKKRRTGQ